MNTVLKDICARLSGIEVAIPNKNKRASEKERQEDLQRTTRTLGRDVNGLLQIAGTESRIIKHSQHDFVDNANQEVVDRYIKSFPPTSQLRERNTTQYGTPLTARELQKN